jgi:hypothetical protein
VRASEEAGSAASALIVNVQVATKNNIHLPKLPIMFVRQNMN